MTQADESKDRLFTLADIYKYGFYEQRKKETSLR